MNLNRPHPLPQHVVIIGGGIAGLAAAYAVREEARQTQANIQCTIVERDPRWGGKILTQRADDCLIEGGPDSFLTSKPWALDMCRQLGLQKQLIETQAHNNRTFSYCRGALRELPQGLLSFRPQRVDTLVSSGLLSWQGMLRMAAERFWPSKRHAQSDESLAEFFRRRFGTEAFDNIIEPLVAGIYAGDADELSLDATFPRFRELERVYGSVIKGMRQSHIRSASSPQASQPPPTLFMSLRGGLGELIDTLVDTLRHDEVNLLTGTGCRTVHRTPPDSGRFQVTLENGETLGADAVVIATPAFHAAGMLRSFQPEMATVLEKIPYSSTATISMAYRVEDIHEQIRGFGFVVPRKAGRPLLAATWTSLKWPDRCEADKMLIRGYIGGKGREAVLEQDDDALVRCVRQELESLAGIGAVPLFTKVHRWIQGMPQYVLGHQDRLAQVQRHLAGCPGLYLTGAGYKGIGIPDCIREGSQVGHQIVQDFLIRKGVSGKTSTASNHTDTQHESHMDR